MLRNTWHSISPSLCRLFNRSLSTGHFPSDWKLSNVTPVNKSGDKRSVSNYCPISLLSIPSKLLERIVHRKLLRHLLDNSILSPRQFGFRLGSSTQEALLTATHDWHRSLDRGLSTAALFLDLSNAFDRVPHNRLLSPSPPLASPAHYSSGSRVTSLIAAKELSWTATLHLHFPSNPASPRVQSSVP